jgi:hypothetical protein
LGTSISDSLGFPCTHTDPVPELVASLLFSFFYYHYFCDYYSRYHYYIIITILIIIIIIIIRIAQKLILTKYIQLRGIRLHFVKLLNNIKGDTLAKAQLGLGHRFVYLMAPY